MERVFKRKIYEKLLQWKEQRKGATALLIEGARRVGKSTIVKQFAQSEYKSYMDCLSTSPSFIPGHKTIWESEKADFHRATASIFP